MLAPMLNIPEDIYTEPEDFSPDTLANLGPLRPLAGEWRSDAGVDVSPKAEGPERRVYIEHIRMEPIDPQPNGPQLLYGLRYHIHVNTAEEDITFHDQVGYWLWEPATGALMQTFSIPRGQAGMAVGNAAADAKAFRLQAVRGSTVNGIVSNPFLEYGFRTESYTITVTINADGTWSYELDTVLIVPNLKEPFHHTDRNTLRKIGEPTLNPTARA